MWNVYGAEFITVVFFCMVFLFLEEFWVKFKFCFYRLGGVLLRFVVLISRVCLVSTILVLFEKDRLNLFLVVFSSLNHFFLIKITFLGHSYALNYVTSTFEIQPGPVDFVSAYVNYEEDDVEYCYDKDAGHDGPASSNTQLLLPDPVCSDEQGIGSDRDYEFV